MALEEPYNPVSSFKHKSRHPGRHVSVEIKAFMPMSLALTSPDKFNTLCCKWGWVTKTIWLDDPGAKRDIDENDLDFLATEAVPTTPKENLTPETLSATRCPDWVENKIREEKRQEAAIIQFYKIEEEELAAYGRFLESNEDDAEFLPNNELDRLLEGNEDIEI